MISYRYRQIRHEPVAAYVWTEKGIFYGGKGRWWCKYLHVMYNRAKKGTLIMPVVAICSLNCFGRMNVIPWYESDGYFLWKSDALDFYRDDYNIMKVWDKNEPLFSRPA